MRKTSKLISLTFLSLLAMGTLLTANVYAGEKQFFSGISGTWRGPGEIVAGKYKGTKFTCNLKGHTTGDNIGMAVDGTCRIGMFSQPMSAKIEKSGAKYSGQFLDGEKGEGMDVTGGRFTSSRFVVGLKRQKLDATMVARLEDDNKLNVTVSVNVRGQLVPVIGMSLGKITRLSMLNQ